MVDSVIPAQVAVPHALYIVGPDSSRFALKINNDGSINVTGSSGSNPSVGVNNAAAPASSTEIGTIDAGGKLQGVSAANPLPVAGSFSASFAEPVLNVQGTAASAAVLSNFPLVATTGYRTAAVQVTTCTAGNTVIAEESNDGTTWYGVQSVGDTVVQSTTAMTALGKYVFPVSALQFRLRCSVYVSGSVAANTEFRNGLTSYAGAAVTLQGTPAVSVSNFPATQAVSGTITANAGVNLNTSLLALETGGNLAILAGSITASVVQTNLKQVNGVVTLVGAGAVGTGAQRVAIGADTATIAGSAPGTAGTPSANVITVQGAAGAQPVLEAPDTAQFASGAANVTTTTSTQLIALVSAKRLYINTVSLSNTSATGTIVTFQDGSGGAALWVMYVPATGGSNLACRMPFIRTTAGTALFFAAGTGVTTLYANAAGYAL